MQEPATSNAENVRRAESNLERLIEWIPRHDTKASVLFGVQAAMVGALAAVTPTPFIIGGSAYLLLATIGALLIAIVFNGLGMFPNVRGPKQSLLFFCSIANRSSHEFQKQWMQLQEDEYLADLLEQIHVNSLIAERKYTWLKRAYVLTAAATLPWAASIYLLHK